MSHLATNIKQSVIDIFKVWKHEFHNIFRDLGVVVFFLILPLTYPIVYTLIYNPELVRDVPVVIIDNDRSPESREYVRSLDANQYVKVIGYAADKAEAQRAMHEKACFGILEIPNDFSKKIGRGESAQVDMYADMSLLVQYKSILTALSDVTMAVGAHLNHSNMPDLMGAVLPKGSSPIPSYGINLGNTSAGFASFLIPGILILILQQSLILGIVMLGAGERERRRITGIIEPSTIRTGVFNTMIGKALCYYTVFIVMTMYVLYFVPRFFSLPQVGHHIDINIFVMPFLFATIFFGMVIQNLAREREDAFLLIVFTSVIFLFLSGLTWPRYAIPEFWKIVSYAFPATWAVDGFVHINTDGAGLHQVAAQYHAMWIQTAIYFLLAFILFKWRKSKSH